MCVKKEKWLEQSFGITSNLAGAVAGAAVGSVTGPLGTVVGAIVGTIAEQAVVLVGNEIKERVLSKNECKRVGTVYQIAAGKINENLEAGKELRNDGFFDKDADGRSAGEEILEGVLLVAQKEYEEKKLKYIGNLYANLAFEKSITPQSANMLIKLAETLTYRQLCEISTVARMQANPSVGRNPLLQEPFHTVAGMNNISIASELFDLYQKTILASSDASFDAAGINPSKLKVVGNGASLYQMMELYTIPVEDLVDIIGILTGNIITEVSEKLVAGEAKVTATWG